MRKSVPEIEWMQDILGKTYQEELVEDMLTLTSSFSNKIYGKRSAENRRIRRLESKSRGKKNPQK